MRPLVFDTKSPFDWMRNSPKSSFSCSLNLVRDLFFKLKVHFIVFRSTIEFRGAPFVGWITDLSQPDYLFALPFEVPLYGGSVAILPILMGVSMFLTMRITMQATEGSQKTFMYFMNGFFILLFNSFPSGLNLYYTTYNLMSFLQQRGIRNKLSA